MDTITSVGKWISLDARYVERVAPTSEDEPPLTLEERVARLEKAVFG